jgi:ArsR family transcriptional regulator, arsenate/arsenite/antimonite-responsive transcriptional repressor
MPTPTQQLATRFKTLAEPTRLDILALLLNHGELCVCDLEAVLGICQSNCSRHLRTLANAGLVEWRRVGVWVHYRISDAPSVEAGALLSVTRELLDAGRTADLLARLARRLVEKGEPTLCGRKDTGGNLSSPEPLS